MKITNMRWKLRAVNVWSDADQLHVVNVYLLSVVVWEWTWWLLTGWDGLSISKDPEEEETTGSEITWLMFQDSRTCRGGWGFLTSLQNLSDAGVVGLQLHLKLGQFLVQFAQVTVHLVNTDSLNSGSVKHLSFCHFQNHHSESTRIWSSGSTGLKHSSCECVDHQVFDCHLVAVELNNSEMSTCSLFIICSFSACRHHRSFILFQWKTSDSHTHTVSKFY